MLSWFSKKRQCKFCDKNLEEDNPQLKLETADGILVLDICDSCADSLDEIRKKLTRSDA